eukprot:TRINITY_DN8204_c0_g2_i2.p1 TRINITY_DN8204_c0_g2~~TRINITY_DN8204_c0_g2_i2.p1  ORF type:complete len:304 (-),score=17.61 TRINITY_DN8204_c0_g2_i2:102-1013(-)
MFSQWSDSNIPRQSVIVALMVLLIYSVAVVVWSWNTSVFSVSCRTCEDCIYCSPCAPCPYCSSLCPGCPWTCPLPQEDNFYSNNTDGIDTDELSMVLSTQLEGPEIDCSNETLITVPTRSNTISNWYLCGLPQNWTVFSVKTLSNYVFENILRRSFSCRVFNYTFQTHQDVKSTPPWKRRLSQLRHSKKPLDVLKLDLNRSNWSVLRDLIDDGTLNVTRQLLLEINMCLLDGTEQMSEIRTSLNAWYKIFIDLHEQGFRTFSSNGMGLSSVSRGPLQWIKPCRRRLSLLNKQYFPEAKVYRII